MHYTAVAVGRRMVGAALVLVMVVEMYVVTV